MKPNEVDNRRCNFNFINLFLEKGAIHGLPYVGKGRLTFLERILWLLLAFVALYFSIHLALESLHRFRTKSTVISSEIDYQYWNTTLASVTLCPMNRLSREKFDAYCGVKNITGSDKVELFEFLESLANSTYFNFNNIIEHQSIDKHNIEPKDYIYLIYNLTNDSVRDSNQTFLLKSISDSSIINSQQILTEWGICYSTNNILIDDLSTSNLLFGKPLSKIHFQENLTLYSTFYRNIHDDETMITFLGIDGPIQYFLHGAFEVMSIQKNNGIKPLPVECVTQVLDIIATDDFAKSTTLEQRQCRFPHESNLTHFPIYTRNLCLQECRINMVYKLCKCIPHFYPNRDGKKPVCHYKVLKNCLFQYSGVLQNVNKITNSSLGLDEIQCYCLPNCRSSQLIEQTCQSVTEASGLLGGNGIFILLRNYPRLRFQRQIIFTLTDLLVSIGGTTGFFLGSSVLSAVEIVYYFTIRLIWHCFGYRE